MMDQNLGRFEIFEVPPPAYDPYPDPRSHLRRQLRITGETLLLRNPGIALSGLDREIGCKWYQKNIRNATLPGNVYASLLDCSLHEIDETRRAIALLFQQVYKFGNQALPRMFALLTGPSSKLAILELYTFLKNLQVNLSVLEKCVPGQNSGTPLLTIMAQDPISRSHHSLMGKLLLSVSEVVLCCKCPQISPENFLHQLEFGDDLLRIAFLIQRFTYDVHPAIGSAILKYGDRLGTSKSQSSHVSYDEIHLRAGSYIPYFRLGERTDGSTVVNGLRRLHHFIHTELKYSAEKMLDLIDEGMMVAANAIVFDNLVVINNLINPWFCKQFRYKKMLAVWTSEKGPEVIEELADAVYRYNDARAPFERMMRFDITKNLVQDISSFIGVMINSLSTLRTQALRANDHPAIAVKRKRTIEFLTKLYTQIRTVVKDPVSFSKDETGPFDAFYDEQDAYMNKLVYERLAIGTSQNVLPLIKRPVHVEACRLTTKKPDLDHLMCIDRWPKETVMHFDVV